jgi:hypothetical protein
MILAEASWRVLTPTTGQSSARDRLLQRASSSPKRIAARKNSDLYYYYAAFAQPFIEGQIIELDLPQGSLILDPWAGSGTTLAAANRLGHRSFGCDLNPVSVLLSKSRFASRDDAQAVTRKLKEAFRTINDASDSRPETMLWTLRELLLGHKSDRTWAVDRYQTVSTKDALLAASLFFFAREAARATRSKNPSWRKNQTSARLTSTQLKSSYASLLSALKNQFCSPENTLSNSGYHLKQLNNEFEPITSIPFADAVITSPPYLTRLDYGVATGLEWRLVKDEPAADLSDWRASFTGSVLTDRMPTSIYPLPRSVGDVLSAIQSHDSKAARTYYFHYFRNYFVGIQNALGNITDACKSGAKGLFVVQDSQFKNLNVPLTRMFADMLRERGWRIGKIEPFSIPPTFYKINSRRWAVENFVSSENLIRAERE